LVLEAFYPLEAVIVAGKRRRAPQRSPSQRLNIEPKRERVAFVLAFVPYLLIRGPVARLAVLWQRRREKEKLSVGSLSMATIAPEGHEERFQVKVTADSHFAWLRTRLAIERTIMAWVRTSVALIGFGFTIVQFFERFASFEGVAAARRSLAPRYVGLVLIAAGVMALLISAWQYRALLGYMWQNFGPIAGVDKAPHRTPVYAIIIAMIFIGVFAFLAVLTRAV
jgi:putative membrane protein